MIISMKITIKNVENFKLNLVLVYQLIIEHCSNYQGSALTG